MDLINLALQFKDFEWIKELMKLEDNVEASGTVMEDSVEASSTVMEESVKADLFNEESVALENITNTYAVRERIGIRAFNINSEYDRNLSDLVMVERPSYRKGEKVKYRKPSNEEIIFARGIVNGYVLGYSEANNNLNNQLLEYFGSIESQILKKEAGIGNNQKKITRPRKTKTPKQ